MILYLKNDPKDFKTIFLRILCMFLGLNENNLIEIKYIEENFENKNLKKLPLHIPQNPKEKFIESDELEISKQILKDTGAKSLSNLSSVSNQFIKNAISKFNYNISKILPELNNNINSLEFANNSYKISIFDLFFFSLISIKAESLLPEIQSKFKNVFLWIKYMLSLNQIYEICNNLKIYKIFIDNLNNLQDNFINNDDEKNKYYVLYNNKDGLGSFTEFNGKKIYNESNNNFIEGQIYYFFSKEKDRDLKISNQTKIYKYILENKICLEQNTPFSTFGKIMEKNENIFIILSDIYKQVIFLDDKENIMTNSKLNEFNYYLGMKIISFNEDSIFVETTKISQIKKTKSNKKHAMMNLINKKILIKYNFIDYLDNNNNYYNNISLYNSCEKIIIEINNKTIYFAYNEEKISNEYFPQNIELFKKENNSIFSKYRILVLKGYCNEINIFINCTYGFAYEYYYISKRMEILPKTIEIQLDNKKYNSDKFWKFDTFKRQKITFINIPNQDTSLNFNSCEYNSFLKIISCINDNQTIEYGTFLLDKLLINLPKKVEINSSFQALIKNINEDILLYQKGQKNSEYLNDKYLGINKDKYINEFKYDYRGFYFPDDLEYFNYFNNICIWMILAKTNDKERGLAFVNYFKNLSLIKKKNESKL